MSISDYFHGYRSLALVLPLIGALAGCGNEKVENNTSTPHPTNSNPVEVFQEFSAALRAGNLETVLSYVHPDSKTMRKGLSGEAVPEQMAGYYYGESLSVLGEQLANINLTLKEDFGNYRDYAFPCGGYECGMRFLKDDKGEWKIERF